MSLVSDALKKAQREAALREAREKGLPEPLLAGAQPFRARRGRRAPTLAAGAAVLALAGFAAYFIWKATPPAGPTPEKRSVEGKPGASAALEAVPAAATPAPSASEPPRRAESPATVPGSAPTVATPAASATPAPSTAAAAPPPPSMDVSAGTTRAPVPASPPAAAPPAPKAQPAPASREAAEASFVRTATLPDGGELRLGGIAWSETAPLAYLNGRLVGVGEMVAGCAVRGIEKESVSLTCSGAALRLRLR